MKKKTKGEQVANGNKEIPFIPYDKLKAMPVGTVFKNEMGAKLEITGFDEDGKPVAKYYIPDSDFSVIEDDRIAELKNKPAGNMTPDELNELQLFYKAKTDALRKSNRESLERLGYQIV